MPRVTLLQTSFTSGELSPRVHGRVDVARYASGAEEITNGRVMLQGGVIRDWGTRFVVPTKDSGAKVARLLPFIFNRTQAYVLEFGDLYMRVFRADGTRVETSPGVAYEIATPYTAAQVAAIDYTQGADTMFLWHESVATQRLVRFGDADWVMQPLPLIEQPSDEIGDRVAQVGTLSATTVGAGRTLTIPSALFLAGDVGRTVSSGAGLATITAVASGTSCTVTITRSFASATLASNGWVIGESPRVTVTPSATGPVGATITLTASAASWRSGHVGGYVRMNGGLVRITAVTTTTAADAVVLIKLADVTAAPADAWALELPVWNAVDGYPRTGTLWEQRLVAAGSPRFPQTVWGSRTAEPFNFSRGVADDDGFAFALQSDEVNPIAYMASGRTLVALTLGGEFTLQGGIEKPIAPTNVQIRSRSNHGCALVRPVRVAREELFIQRGGRKVRALSYNATNDDYTAPDVSVLAEHLTAPGIVDLAYQRSPEPWVHALRSDGRIAGCTYDRQDEDVVAWVTRSTGGGSDAFESMAVVPDASGSEALWCIVRRTVNGATVRYVERFNSTAASDCEVTGTSVGGQSAWSGLSHLEGRSVDVVADGSYAGRFTVSGGAITLPRAANSVSIGLPFTLRIVPLTPELQMADGSAQGNSMRVAEISLRLLSSVGGAINGQRISARILDQPAVLDRPMPSVTGVVRIESLGWDRGDAPLVIEQPDPLPFHLLQLIRKVTVNS